MTHIAAGNVFATIRKMMAGGRGVDGDVSSIRILLVGVPRMLNEIVRVAIAAEPDMAVVEGGERRSSELAAYTRRRRINVVIFVSGNEEFADDKILGLLHANPRLSLLAIDGRRDRGTLYHLVPAHDAIDGLAQSSLTAAIRAGAALRVG